MDGRKLVWNIAVGETGASRYNFSVSFCYAGIVYVEIILMHKVNDIIGL
jgi:hypothetical protein